MVTITFYFEMETLWCCYLRRKQPLQAITSKVKYSKQKIVKMHNILDELETNLTLYLVHHALVFC